MQQSASPSTGQPGTGRPGNQALGNLSPQSTMHRATRHRSTSYLSTCVLPGTSQPGTGQYTRHSVTSHLSTRYQWPDAIYQDSTSKLPWFSRRKFLLPYMSMAAILSKGAEHLNKLSIPFQQKAPCEIWWKLFKQFQRRRHLNKMVAVGTILDFQSAQS